MLALTLLSIRIIIGLIIFMSSGNTFGEKKSRIMNLYSSVLSDMNIDYRDNGVNTVNIHEISRSIQNLAEYIEDTAVNIKKESPENRKWFTGIIDEFNTQLHMWIDRHTDELEIIESEVQNTQSMKISEKAVLELTYNRLNSHRLTFEK